MEKGKEINKFLKEMFDGIEGYRVISEDQKGIVKVYDYMMIEGEIRAEEYSSFEKNVFVDFIKEGYKEDEISEKTIDFLSELKMWVTEYEECSGVDIFEEMFLLDTKEIAISNPDEMLGQFLLDIGTTKICKF